MVSLTLRGVTNALLIVFALTFVPTGSLARMPPRVGRSEPVEPPSSLEQLTDNLTHLFQTSRQTASDSAAMTKVRMGFQKYADAVVATDFRSKDLMLGHINEYCKRSEEVGLALLGISTARTKVLEKVRTCLSARGRRGGEYGNRSPLGNQKNSTSETVHHPPSGPRIANPVNMTLNCLKLMADDLRYSLYPPAIFFLSSVLEMGHSAAGIFQLVIQEPELIRHQQKPEKNTRLVSFGMQLEHFRSYHELALNVTTDHLNLTATIEEVIGAINRFIFDLEHPEVIRASHEHGWFQHQRQLQVETISKFLQSMAELRLEEHRMLHPAIKVAAPGSRHRRDEL